MSTRRYWSKRNVAARPSLDDARNKERSRVAIARARANLDRLRANEILTIAEDEARRAENAGLLARAGRGDMQALRDWLAKTSDTDA
jgi:hypothetical protein